jgi:hypothetical protein
MAKGRQKRKERESAGDEPALVAKALPGSLLSLAFQSYEAGDMVLARRAAKAALAKEPTAKDVEAARKIAPALFDPPVGKDAPPVPNSPKDVAQELLARTEVAAKPYLFVAVGVALIVLLIVLALIRT